MDGLRQQLQMLYLRIGQHFGGVIHRRVRHVPGLEQFTPLRTRPALEVLAQHFDEDLLVGDTLLTAAELRVLQQLRVLDGIGQALPEFFRRRHVQRDPLAVAAFQHIGLRYARAAVRAHELVSLQIVRERVEIEVAHGFEHRDFNRAAYTGAAALDQGAQNAIGGIKAGQRIGDSRAHNARVVRVDQQMQKARSSLCHGVVSRAVGLGSGGAEAADGAIDQARIDLM